MILLPYECVTTARRAMRASGLVPEEGRDPRIDGVEGISCESTQVSVGAVVEGVKRVVVPPYHRDGS
jgi:hypothetical protein